MAEITCLRELEERGELKTSDIVEFIVKEQIIKYNVCYSCLSNRDNFPFDYIFDILKIDKYKLAKKAYRYGDVISYSSKNSCWPVSKHNDFPALTRLVKELYLIIEEREFKFTKFSRFEIMEI